MSDPYTCRATTTARRSLGHPVGLWVLRDPVGMTIGEALAPFDEFLGARIEPAGIDLSAMPASVVAVTDPVAWAKALEQLAGATANINGLIEMNADAIADAEAASGAVAAYVSRVMAGKGTPAAGTQIAVPTKNGRPDLAAWLTLCREAFATADAETLDTIWRQVDGLSAKLPQATRAAIAKTYANRKDALGMSQAPAGQEASQAPAIEVAEDGDRPDPFEAIASELIDQIHETGNSHEMEALRRNAAVASQLRRLEAEAPALADRVKAAATRHSQSWGQPPQD